MGSPQGSHDGQHQEYGGGALGGTGQKSGMWVPQRDTQLIWEQQQLRSSGDRAHPQSGTECPLQLLPHTDPVGPELGEEGQEGVLLLLFQGLVFAISSNCFWSFDTLLMKLICPVGQSAPALGCPHHTPRMPASEVKISSNPG